MSDDLVYIGGGQMGHGGGRTYLPSESDSTPCTVTDADRARDFLVRVMNCEFTDKTFERYIRNELAGDFACELKQVITKLAWVE